MVAQNTFVVGVKSLIVHNGKVLIIKRSLNSIVGPGTWELVGGKVEFGENFENALHREAKEEVGLAIQIENILYATTFQTDPTRQVVLVTYLCSSEDAEVTLSNEHYDYRWATLEQLKQYLPLNILEDFEKNDVLTLLAKQPV